MKNKTKSLIEIHIAVLLFGLAGLFGKLISLPSTIIVLGRVFFAVNNPKMALNYAKKIAGKNDLIVITGSIYVVGEVI